MLKNIRASIDRFLHSPSYFILYSVYPILWAYAYNVYGVLLVELIRPLLISLLLALLFFGALQFKIHDPQTSALTVFSVFFAFFNYGHTRAFLNSFQIPVRDGVLAVAWFVVTLLALLWVIRSGRNWNKETVAVSMNLMMIILLLFPLLRLLVYSVKRGAPLERKVDYTVPIGVNSTSPDIYYIILDAYTRSDVMDKYGYDNSEFIHSLQDMGFYVAECSQSNYGMTSLSLSAALNMDYLQNISDAYQPGENDLLYAFKALDSNVLRNTLTDAGYETTAFASGFTWAEWRDADHFMAPEKGGITEFELLVLFTTYARTLDDFGLVNLDDIHAEHYRIRTHFILDNFDELLKLPSPKFVFVHIIAPHEPYGLDEYGNDINPDQVDHLDGYTNQARFISTAILPQLQKLIDGSDNPPVIVLQGDHGLLGSDPSDLMKILNAYYLPGHAGRLYPSITPVNSFRLVLNSYFGTDFPLLEDVSYYSSLADKYDFSVIPNTCP